MSNVFINKAKREDIPSNAVLLSRREALEMQWDMIRKWTPNTDVWPITFGAGVLASINAATSLNIVKYFRSKLKLQNHGRITLALPSVIIPSALSFVSHRYYVTNEIILGENCPLCTQTRATVMQAIIGGLFPLLTTPIAAFFYAATYNTYDVPAIRLKNAPKVWSLWLVMISKMKSKLPIIIGINAMTGAALTYFEANSFYKMQSIIYENEKQFRAFVDKRSQQL